MYWASSVASGDFARLTIVLQVGGQVKSSEERRWLFGCCLVACKFILRVTLLILGKSLEKTGKTRIHLSSPGTLFQRVNDVRRDVGAQAGIDWRGV